MIFFDVPATGRAATTPAPRRSASTATSTSSPSSTAGSNGLGPWTPTLRGRPALRPRRRRRRLRDLRRDHRDQGARPAGHRAAALRRPDRDLRGERLARPAVLRRRARRPRSGNVAPRRLPRQRRRQLRPALAHHQPARHASRGTLKVEILTEGVHSGDASGLVPSSFRILRQVLDRLEDSARPGGCCPRASTARFRPTASSRRKATAQILGDEVWKRFPWACGADGGRTLPTTDRPGRGAAQPHLAADAVGHRRRRLAGAARTRATCCARTPRSSSACALPPLVDGNAGGAGAEDAARGQRALQRQGHLPRRRPRPDARRRDRLERAEPRAVARGRARTPRRRRTSARPAATSARAARSR